MCARKGRMKIGGRDINWLKQDLGLVTGLRSPSSADSESIENKLSR